MTDYAAFLASKLASSPPTGITVDVTSDRLFPFQRDLVTWALKRGRAALFADTGLGKTRMQLIWAHHVQKHTGGRILILAPLSVAKQTAAEGEAVGVLVVRASYGGECTEPGIYVTNYDKLHKFADANFDAVVLDESSIIKHHDAKTLAVLLDRFRSTPFKLCASATPSPNDYTELGTHAEFLGVCSRAEMLAEFFCHDGSDTSKWRLKGHARQAFWRWVSAWAALLRRPSDLGYDDAGYDLPALRTHEHRSDADPDAVKGAGLLFAEPASTLTERRDARRSTMATRVKGAIDLVRADSDQWVIWCELNAEQDALRKELGDQCVSIAGAQDSFTKELLHDQWLRGELRILLTKPSIFGFGLNWQHAHKMAFVGVTDSFESYYQAVRRMWRFGQRSEVDVHLFYNELEGDVLANLKRKGEDANKMGDELSAETRAMVASEVRGAKRETNAYESRGWTMPEWLVRRGADSE
jgi:hypothetical protein